LLFFLKINNLGEPLRFARVGLSAPSLSPLRGFGGSATIPLAKKNAWRFPTPRVPLLNHIPYYCPSFIILYIAYKRNNEPTHNKSSAHSKPVPVPRLQLVHSWGILIVNFCSSSSSCIFCFSRCAWSLAIFKTSLSIAFCVFVCGWLWLAWSCSGIFYRFRYEIIAITITRIAIVRIVLFVSSAGVGSSPQYHHPAAAPAARAG